MARSPSQTPFRPAWGTGHEAVPRLPNPATSINNTFGCSMPRKAPPPHCLDSRSLTAAVTAFQSKVQAPNNMATRLLHFLG